MSKASKRRSAIAIGTFDGVHRGHQRILQQLNEEARSEHLERIAYAFVFPPRLAVRGETRGLLLPEALKVKLLSQYVDRVERATFEDVSNIAPEEFVTRVLLEELRARAIVVGENFRFGRGRAGDISLLREICEKESVSIVAIPPVIVDGGPVSSTRIRRLIAEGNVEAVSVLLGRPPLLIGAVIRGDRLGSALGYPTANLSIDPRVLLPRDGIYLVNAFWDTRRSRGLLYLGTRPTVHGTEHRCEVYLFAETQGSESAVGDLYGKTLEVHLQQKLRDDRHFSNILDLRKQIERDVEQARDIAPTLSQGPIFT